MAKAALGEVAFGILELKVDEGLEVGGNELINDENGQYHYYGHHPKGH